MNRKLLPGTIGVIATALSVGTTIGKPPAPSNGGQAKAPALSATDAGKSGTTAANPKEGATADFGSIPKAGDTRLAVARVTADKISWRPLVRDYGSIQLRVTGPGIEPYHATFEPGDKIEFPFFDEETQIWSDGLYKWELTSSPKVSAKNRELMQQARNNNSTLSKGALADKLRSEGILPDPGLTESGTFRIREGRAAGLQEADRQEAPPEVAQPAGSDRDPRPDGVQLRDQQIFDDLIVVGSECVGQDCVNGESFGFDTLRLKENNLRMHFQDTSSSASFPTNDWRIVINDSSNGGSNYFAVEDSSAGQQVFRVDAGAPANSLRVDSGGDVGIGTATPVTQVHIADGNTPTVRLEQNGSSGFTPQTWDVAGNETNFFIRDATNGSNLPFRIKPSAPTSSIDIAANGNVGFGTSQPTAPLHVQRTDGTAAIRVEETSGTTGARLLLALENNGPTVMSFHNVAHTNPWTVNHSTAGNLVFNSDDTAGPEFEILATGGIAVNNTQLNVPDYVFEEGYKLRSVEELSSFIKEKGHLPGVTSAKEVASAGRINITEMQMQMLEKIEELALYTIQQHEVIEELRSRLGELEKADQ